MYKSDAYTVDKEKLLGCDNITEAMFARGYKGL